jgi:hypothetical protein
MNERIKELEDQCWEDIGENEYYFNRDKFAELLIRKCMLLTERCMDDDTIFALNGAEIIAEHFGVENGTSFL